jgi:hypothetical protein
MQVYHYQLIRKSITRDIEGLRLDWIPQFAGGVGGGFFAVSVLRLSLNGWAGCHFGLTCKPLLAFWPRWRLGSGATDRSALGFSETSTLALVGSHATTSSVRCI